MHVKLWKRLHVQRQLEALYLLSLWTHPEARPWLQVGLLDIDICGPSIPKMLGLEGEEIHHSNAGWSPVYVDDNLGVMSIGGPAVVYVMCWEYVIKPATSGCSMCPGLALVLSDCEKLLAAGALCQGVLLTTVTAHCCHLQDSFSGVRRAASAWQLLAACCLQVCRHMLL